MRVQCRVWNDAGDLLMESSRTIDIPRETVMWWLNTTLDDLSEAAPKMEEYGGQTQGSADLRVMGRAISELGAWDDEVPQAVAQELACWFYLTGKVSRLVADYQHQRPGKVDTWHDATVYTMMARHIQTFGRWP